MAQRKAKNYDITFTIRFRGRSVEQEDGGTFMGTLLTNCIETFIQAVKLQFPKVKVDSERSTVVRVKKFKKNDK